MYSKKTWIKIEIIFGIAIVSGAIVITHPNIIPSELWVVYSMALILALTAVITRD